MTKRRTEKTAVGGSGSESLPPSKTGKRKRRTRARAGDLVSYEGQTFRVLKRRQVTGFAMPAYDDYELLLASPEGVEYGYVGESETELLPQ